MTCFGRLPHEQVEDQRHDRERRPARQARVQQRDIPSRRLRVLPRLECLRIKALGTGQPRDRRLWR